MRVVKAKRTMATVMKMGPTLPKTADRAACT